MIFYNRQGGELMSVFDNQRRYNSDYFHRADIPPVRRDNISEPHVSDFKKEDKKTPDSLKKLIDSILENSPDSDKLLVIALMFLLAKEGADMKLILALGYILL